AVLCPRFAVISRGRLVAETTPTLARRNLEGAIFEGRGSDEKLQELRRGYRVTQAILVEGENRLRLHVPDRRPPQGFTAVEPTLEDAYMTLVAQDATVDAIQENGTEAVLANAARVARGEEIRS
ncbi:MAG TPA: hypothetical protein VFR10_02505, partial [bacterium]|nr:hypothetical protein [bacterium]